jgi:hypothetical protein
MATRKKGGGCSCQRAQLGGDNVTNLAMNAVAKTKAALVRQPVNQSGGYKATAKDLQYLKKYRQGKSIGFTMIASLKAKGLLPRSSKTMKGKKVVSAKYK